MTDLTAPRIQTYGIFADIGFLMTHLRGVPG
jgi:hypothetical protein